MIISSIQFSFEYHLRFQASPLCTLSFISCCSIFKDHPVSFSFKKLTVASHATQILYHISERLSRGFSKVFQLFFQATRCLSKFRLILSVNLRRFLFKEAQLTSTMSISLALRFTRPLYYIISSRVCQVVLKKFFKFFSKTFQKLSLPFLTRLLYYIISYAVCQVVFENFLKFFFDALANSLLLRSRSQL